MNIIQAIQLILLYFIVGYIWMSFIEYSVVGKVPGRAGEPFTARDRAFQICLWPASMVIFFYNFFKYFLEEWFK